MRYLLVALLCALSYAQTEKLQKPKQMGGMPNQMGGLYDPEEAMETQMERLEDAAEMAGAMGGAMGGAFSPAAFGNVGVNTGTAGSTSITFPTSYMGNMGATANMGAFGAYGEPGEAAEAAAEAREDAAELAIEMAEDSMKMGMNGMIPGGAFGTITGVTSTTTGSAASGTSSTASSGSSGSSTTTTTTTGTSGTSATTGTSGTSTGTSSGASSSSSGSTVVTTTTATSTGTTSSSTTPTTTVVTTTTAASSSSGASSGASTVDLTTLRNCATITSPAQCAGLAYPPMGEREMEVEMEPEFEYMCTWHPYTNTCITAEIDGRAGLLPGVATPVTPTTVNTGGSASSSANTASGGFLPGLLPGGVPAFGFGGIEAEELCMTITDPQKCTYPCTWMMAFCREIDVKPLQQPKSQEQQQPESWKLTPEFVLLCGLAFLISVALGACVGIKVLHRNSSPASVRLVEIDDQYSRVV